MSGKRPVSEVESSPSKNSPDHKKSKMGGKDRKDKSDSAKKEEIKTSEEKLEKLFEDWGTKLQLSISNAEAKITNIDTRLSVEVKKVLDKQTEISTDLQSLKDSFTFNEGRMKDVEKGYSNPG